MSSAAAQDVRDDVLRAGNIPAGLRPLLVERIERYVEAQRPGEGERVSGFLAGNQQNPPGRPYSDEQKQCIGIFAKRKSGRSGCGSPKSGSATARDGKAG